MVQKAAVLVALHLVSTVAFNGQDSIRFWGTTTTRDRTERAFVSRRRKRHYARPKDQIPFGTFTAPRTRQGGTYSARFLEDNGLEITTDSEGRVTARPRQDSARTATTKTATTKSHQRTGKKQKSTRKSAKTTTTKLDLPSDRQSLTEDLQQKKKGLPSIRIPHPKPKPLTEHPAKVVPKTGFNVILTHCTADFDSLASAVGLAKLWSGEELEPELTNLDSNETAASFDSASDVPTFVVLPRGAHPGVHRFLALHKHLFPIRSLRSLPSDLSGLNRLALVDAQRRDRLGPAEPLLQHAKRVTVVDHHIDQDSDIAATDYVVDQVGSVTTLIVERLQQTGMELSEAEATLLALGVHADTGSLCFDSTTPRDAHALAWCLSQGASQAAIAEHAQSSLSQEQQGVLTQALMNANATLIYGVTLSTVLLSADGFINGLAAVTQDALELSSSDIFLLGLVYQAQSGGKRRRGGSKKRKLETTSRLLTSRLMMSTAENKTQNQFMLNGMTVGTEMMHAQAWQGGEEALRRRRLRAAFDRKDVDGSGYLELSEIEAALTGVIASPWSVAELMGSIDTDGNGRIDFEEFVRFANKVEKLQQERNTDRNKSSTMIIIGRVKAGVNMKSVKLNKLLEPFGGGGHAKAASATLRLNDPNEAQGILQGLVNELVATALQEQPTVGDFMTSPVLSVKPTMTEQQVEDLFTRYDVRALPVVDENNDVIGLVTYKEVAAAKQRLWNKEQKRQRQELEAAERGEKPPPMDEKVQQERKHGSNVKGWMKQHVQMVEASKTMSQVESILLENDVGCIPVVADGTKQLVGMVTRTDLLRQHRYYPSLPYHNKGFADSIAARKPIIELRKRLKRFDLD